jgi:hypothetical protein
MMLDIMEEFPASTHLETGKEKSFPTRSFEIVVGEVMDGAKQSKGVHRRGEGHSQHQESGTQANTSHLQSVILEPAQDECSISAPTLLAHGCHEFGLLNQVYVGRQLVAHL